MASKLVKINKNFQVTIPAQLRRKSSIQAGDYVEAEFKKGLFIFKPKRVEDIDPDQAWYWTDKWQKMEREADEAIARGEVKRFRNIDELIKSLKSIK